MQPWLYETAKNLMFIVAIVAPLMLCVAYLTLWERKLIGWIQIRIGPNRVGPFGLLQPVADGIKLLMKEIIVPANANRGLFLLAPVVMLMPALAAAAGHRGCAGAQGLDERQIDGAPGPFWK